MKKLPCKSIGFILLFILSVVFFVRTPRVFAAITPQFRPDTTVPPDQTGTDTRVIVKFNGRPTTKKMSSALSQMQNQVTGNVTAVGGIVGTDAVVYSVPTANLQKAVSELKTNPDVADATVDRKIHAFRLTNDQSMITTPTPGRPALQWNLMNMKVAGSGTSAWDLSTGSPNIVVGVIDTTVDSTQEDLQGKFSGLVDCSGSSCAAVSSLTADAADSNSSHGTHVAGLVAAATDNHLGIAGTGFNTKMLFIKIMNSDGTMQVSSLNNAIRYAADQGVKVINLSLGMSEEGLDANSISILQAAVTYAWNHGTVLIAAAGNCGGDTQGNLGCAYEDESQNILYSHNSKMYPAAFSQVISVAALTVDNALASYSQHNDSSGAGNWITVAAPGGYCTSTNDAYNCIVSTWPGTGAYVYDMGTSMSTPEVSGLAALIWAKNPSLTNQQVRTIIENTSNRTVASGSTNYGAIDALAALQAVPNTVTSPTPTLIISATPVPTSGVTPSITPNPSVSLSPSASPTITPKPSSTPVPTLTPTITPTPWPTDPPRLLKTAPNPYPTGPYCSDRMACTRKSVGDANCDGIIDVYDYRIWRTQNDQMIPPLPITNNSNYACVEGNKTTYFVDLIDYEIWRRNTAGLYITPTP